MGSKSSAIHQLYPDWGEDFLKAFRVTGTVGGALNIIHINRKTYNAYLAGCAIFKEAVDLTRHDIVDDLVGILRIMAMKEHNFRAIQLMLRYLDPEGYGRIRPDVVVIPQAVASYETMRAQLEARLSTHLLEPAGDLVLDADALDGAYTESPDR